MGFIMEILKIDGIMYKSGIIVCLLPGMIIDIAPVTMKPGIFWRMIMVQSFYHLVLVITRFLPRCYTQVLKVNQISKLSEEFGMPFGKHTKNYGKSQFLVGKFTVAIAIFNIKLITSMVQPQFYLYVSIYPSTIVIFGYIDMLRYGRWGE